MRDFTQGYPWLDFVTRRFTLNIHMSLRFLGVFLSCLVFGMRLHNLGIARKLWLGVIFLIMPAFFNF